jgi:hypothetical protein
MQPTSPPDNATTCRGTSIILMVFSLSTLALSPFLLPHAFRNMLQVFRLSFADFQVALSGIANLCLVAVLFLRHG